ncbi:MAG: hypothetical protein J6V40_02455, partial [Clostridia bacterium]|nr:hypothetical protein [Clostridia bacterium]
LNISEDKMPDALKKAYKCIKAKDIITFIYVLAAELAIGGIALLMTLATYLPAWLLLNVVSIAAAFYGLKVDGSIKEFIENLKQKCKANNIPYDDVFGMAKIKEKHNERTKSHIHEDVASRDAATNNMTTTTVTAVPVKEGESPLASLGAMFKSAGGEATAEETVEDQPVEGKTLDEVEASRTDFTGNVIDGEKASIGSLAERMKVNAMNKKMTATTNTKDLHFKTPKLNPSTVETVKNQNSSSMSDMLSQLQNARAHKGVEETSIEESPVEQPVEETIAEEPENKQ